MRLTFQPLLHQASTLDRPRGPTPQHHSSCHTGRHRERERERGAGLCGLGEVTLPLWASHFLLHKLRDRGQVNPMNCLLHPEDREQLTSPFQLWSGRQSFQSPVAPPSPHVVAPWPFPWCPPNTRTVSPPCRGIGCLQFLPGPGLAAGKWLLPTPAPASTEKGQFCQTGGGRWQGPKGPSHSLPQGQEGSGGKQARDSSLRFSGEGRAAAKGSRGPGAQLWGKGRDSGLTPHPHPLARTQGLRLLQDPAPILSQGRKRGSLRCQIPVMNPTFIPLCLLETLPPPSGFALNSWSAEVGGTEYAGWLEVPEPRS